MKRLITICAVVLMLSATGVSWANLVPSVEPPPGAPDWWNVACEQYAYGWWEADIVGGATSPLPVSPLPDSLHWASNFLPPPAFTASVVDNTITINLMNAFREDLYKEIYIYLRGTTISTTNGISSALDTDDGVFEGWYGGSIVGDLWSYKVEGEIHPQPCYVNLTVTVPGLRSVTDIWAGENCIPEPATICLLGLGTLGLIRRRRKK